MSKFVKSAIGVTMLAALAACGGGSDVEVSKPQAGQPAQTQPPVTTPPVTTPPVTEPAKPMSIIADFGTGIDGWIGGSADYYAEDAPSEVVFEQRALGAPLSGKGFFIAGHNRSDDLFLFVKRKYPGLEKNGTYQLTFSLKFASKVASGCAGAGGSPGESVFVYAAATATEPKAIDVEGRKTMNFDKGNQGTPGKEAQILGTIGNGQECGTHIPTSKTVKSEQPLTVKADANGDVWVLIGIDSGFEAQSELTLQSLTVDAVPVTK